MLRDHDLGAALVEVGNDGIAVESLVSDEAAKGETVDERSDADRIKTMSRQENKADQIAERVGQRQDFGVMPPLERPIAWLWVPLLRPGRGGGP